MDGRCPHRHTPKVVDSEECESEWRAVGEQRPRTGTATWIGSQKRLAQSQEIAKVRLGVLSSTWIVHPRRPTNDRTDAVLNDSQSEPWPKPRTIRYSTGST